MSPEVASSRPEVLLCQVMQLGTWEDFRLARELFGEAAIKDALLHAPPGILDKRSWNFWNLFYGSVPIPPMPVRPLP